MSQICMRGLVGVSSISSRVRPGFSAARTALQPHGISEWHEPMEWSLRRGMIQSMFAAAMHSLLMHCIGDQAPSRTVWAGNICAENNIQAMPVQQSHVTAHMADKALRSDAGGGALNVGCIDVGHLDAQTRGDLLNAACSEQRRIAFQTMNDSCRQFHASACRMQHEEEW